MEVMLGKPWQRGNCRAMTQQANSARLFRCPRSYRRIRRMLNAVKTTILRLCSCYGHTMEVDLAFIISIFETPQLSEAPLLLACRISNMRCKPFRYAIPPLTYSWQSSHVSRSNSCPYGPVRHDRWSKVRFITFRVLQEHA